MWFEIRDEKGTTVWCTASRTAVLMAVHCGLVVWSVNRQGFVPGQGVRAEDIAAFFDATDTSYGLHPLEDPT